MHKLLKYNTRNIWFLVEIYIVATNFYKVIIFLWVYTNDFNLLFKFFYINPLSFVLSFVFKNKIL